MAKANSNQFSISPVVAPSYFPVANGFVQANTASFHSGNVPAYMQAGYSNGAEPWAGNGVKGVFSAWCGGIYVPGLGAAGSTLFHGGGHNDYFGNEVYRFDWATRLWSRLNMPTYPFSFDFTRGELGVGQPMSSHTYDHLCHSPNTGGPLGEMILAFQASSHHQAGVGATTSHHFDISGAQPLVVGSGWSRGGTFSFSPANSQFEGFSAYDSTRGVIYHAMSSQVSPLWRYNPTTKVHTQLSTVNMTLDSMWDYSPTIDAVIMSQRRNSSVLRGWDPNVPGTSPIELNESGTPPSDGQHGFTWCGASGEFAAYEYGSSVVRFLKPPTTGSWKTGTWVWRAVNIGGAIATGGTGGGLYSKFRWLSKFPNQFYFGLANNAPNAYIIRAA